mmetsp:Transcript_35425/g.114243  ORF Transcript_35425/g.114243 Transcript_35425/m.114243 type:complete len:225 (+) Transcript_35425:487-1161(+)
MGLGSHLPHHPGAGVPLLSRVAGVAHRCHRHCPLRGVWAVAREHAAAARGAGAVLGRPLPRARHSRRRVRRAVRGHPRAPLAPEAVEAGAKLTPALATDGGGRGRGGGILDDLRQGDHDRRRGSSEGRRALGHLARARRAGRLRSNAAVAAQLGARLGEGVVHGPALHGDDHLDQHRARRPALRRVRLPVARVPLRLRVCHGGGWRVPALVGSRAREAARGGAG